MVFTYSCINIAKRERLMLKREYEQRLDELTIYLKKEKVDIAMITYPPNVFYYTGFNTNPHERFLALIIDTRSNQYFFFVPELDAEIAKNDSIIETIVPISDAQDPFDIVNKTINTDLAIFGLEKKAVTFFRLEELEKIITNATFYDIQPKINLQRMKKSEKEIHSSQKAVDIIERVMKEGIKKVKIGMKEVEFIAELEFLMRKFGADAPAFSTLVLSGEKSALPHGSPDERTFQKGDFLLIDMGVLKNGYCSDITRTFIIGEASEKQKEIYNIVLASNEAGINAIRAGREMKKFDIAARNVIQGAGYGDYFHNRVGHGLGIEVHEEPSVHMTNESIAKSGLLFTIEPGIYIPGYGGVRIEDEVYINKEGQAEVLTSFPKKLQII